MYVTFISATLPTHQHTSCFHDYMQNYLQKNRSQGTDLILPNPKRDYLKKSFKYGICKMQYTICNMQNYGISSLQKQN